MTEAQISPNTTLSRHPDAAWRVLGKLLIAITPGNNKVHRFNETGTFIWNSLENGPLSFSDIRSLMADRFEAEGSEIEKDLLAFVSEIHEKGLLVLNES